MNDAESSDFNRMRDFFYSLGISGATSSSCAMILISPPHCTASPMKLARKISWRNFRLADIGLDDLDVEAVEQNLRGEYPDIFKAKEVAASDIMVESSLKVRRVPFIPNSVALRAQPSVTLPSAKTNIQPQLNLQESLPVRRSLSCRKTPIKEVAVKIAVPISIPVPPSTRSMTQTEVTHNEKKKRGHKPKVINSLSTDLLQIVSGECIVTQSDLVCSGLAFADPNSCALPAFPSVGCKNYPVSKGKWYFEVTVTSGGAQVGWADSNFVGGHDNMGVGDDTFSWAHDGLNKLHGGRDLGNLKMKEWGIEGGFIGCSIDLDSPIPMMVFYLIRDDDGNNNSTASFTRFEFKDSLYPCVSFDEEETVRFNFGDDAFARKIPRGFQAYADHIGLLEGAVDDSVTRSRYRLCDGLRPKIPCIDADRCEVKDELPQLTPEIAVKQWVEIVSKTKRNGFEILPQEKCKGKDLAGKRIAYYFKSSNKGWVLGQVHNKTYGRERLHFNWICNFSGVRRSFYLDDSCYLSNSHMWEGNNVYEAKDMSWVVFGKAAKKRKSKSTGSGRKRKASTCSNSSEIDSSFNNGDSMVSKKASPSNDKESSKRRDVPFTSDQITWHDLSEHEDDDNEGNSESDGGTD